MLGLRIEADQHAAGLVGAFNHSPEANRKTATSEADVTGRVNTYRALTLLMSLVALIGWGAFAYAVKSGTAAQARLQGELDQRQQEIAQLRGGQEQLITERDQAKALAPQLLAERDDAKAQLAVVQQEIAALQTRLEEAQAKRPEPGSTGTPALPEKPASAPARTNRRRR